MRLFVGIPVPDGAKAEIAKAAKVLDGCMGARLLPPENWHLTLKFIGEADEAKRKAIEEALGKVAFAPFTVELFGAGAFPSLRVPRAIWIGGKSQGAQELAAKVEEALSFLGLPAEKFSLHLTVARSKGIADVEEFIAKTGAVCSFDAGKFALVKSTLVAHGAIYEVLREFPAQGQ